MSDKDPDRPVCVRVVAHQVSETGGGAGALPLRLWIASDNLHGANRCGGVSGRAGICLLPCG